MCLLDIDVFFDQHFEVARRFRKLPGTCQHGKKNGRPKIGHPERMADSKALLFYTNIGYTWGVPKMLGFPNNHWFSYSKWFALGVWNGETQHLRKHPRTSQFFGNLHFRLWNIWRYQVQVISVCVDWYCLREYLSLLSIMQFWPIIFWKIYNLILLYSTWLMYVCQCIYLYIGDGSKFSKARPQICDHLPVMYLFITPIPQKKQR